MTTATPARLYQKRAGADSSLESAPEGGEATAGAVETRSALPLTESRWGNRNEACRRVAGMTVAVDCDLTVCNEHSWNPDGWLTDVLTESDSLEYAGNAWDGDGGVDAIGVPALCGEPGRCWNVTSTLVMQARTAAGQ